jgi:hypothetical protein
MRTGNFTSSEIFTLMSEGKKAGTLGAPGLTYIAETNMERRLGRGLDNETTARPTSWGNLCEGHVFSMLPLSYSAVSKESIMHPSIDCWAGTPDSVCYEYETGQKTVADVKCPFTLKSFCQLIDAWQLGGIKAIRAYHKDGEKFYWQIVSNAILTGCNFGELIIFAPYRSELPLLKMLAQHDDFMWVYYAADNELPWIPDAGYYQNLNCFRFPIPEEDKKALTDRVLEARKSLVVPVLIETI